MAIQNHLPDPYNPIDNAGQNLGTYGPGFSAITVSSEQPVFNTRTNSGRLLTRIASGHLWKIDVSYNDLTSEQFNPLYGFTVARGQHTPFYVTLPQQTSTWSGTMTLADTLNPGTTSLTMDSTVNGLSVGEYFNIEAAGHHKTYMVTRVDGAEIGFMPPLYKAVQAGAVTVNADKPSFRVVNTSGTAQYSLNYSNLYKFSLKLEEAL